MGMNSDPDQLTWFNFIVETIAKTDFLYSLIENPKIIPT